MHEATIDLRRNVDAKVRGFVRVMCGSARPATLIHSKCA